jgi:hypothetical protein
MTQLSVPLNSANLAFEAGRNVSASLSHVVRGAHDGENESDDVFRRPTLAIILDNGQYGNTPS